MSPPLLSARPTAEDADGPGTAERRLLLALFLLIALLRAAWILRRGFDSDEWQHYHVAWSWSRGDVQYRDVFDNHMPLFHLLTAPLALAIGERTDVLVLARLAMLPLFASMLWACYAIGRRLWSRRVGLWAAALLGLHAEFFNTSLEFRSDDLWAALWLLSLAVVAGGPWRPGRALGAGLIAGTALCTSLKSLLLLASLAGAALAAPAILPGLRDRWLSRRAALATGAFAVGVAAPLALLVALIAISGLFEPFFRCAVLHNLGTGLSGHRGLGGGFSLFAGLAVLLLAAAWLLTSMRPAFRARPLRLVLLLASGAHAAAVNTVWPVAARQDALAHLPVLAAGAAAVLVHVAERAAARLGRAPDESPRTLRARAAIPALVLAAAAALTLSRLPVRAALRHGTRDEMRLVADVLRLTDPPDRVMDGKGEAVFRRRAMYPALELITMLRLARGEMEDRIPEWCVESRACVSVTELKDFPARGREFLEHNYVPVGPLRVLGRILERPPRQGGSIAFDLVLPERYAVLSEHGEPKAEIDGVPYAGPRFLSAGAHALAVDGGEGRLAVMWARAAERGYTPFGADGR